MRFHKVLDEVFGNKTKLKLLRAFLAYPGKEFSESELERIAGIPQASVHRNVKSLLQNGLLDRRRIGKANLYALNRSHILYSLLSKNFKEEENLLCELKEMIGKTVREIPEVELAILYGSIVKGNERPDSDIDIFIVCRGNKSHVEERLNGLVKIIENKFGNPMSFLIKRREELKGLKQRAIHKDIKEGEVIYRQGGFEW